MRNLSTFLTLFALLLFASDAFAQRGGGGRGGGGPRGGGGGMQMGQGGGQCQGGGGGASGGGSQMQMMMRGGNLTTDQSTTDAVEVVTQMLMSMDRNRDGMISANEVPAPLQSRLNGADANGDGVLNRQEQLAVIDRAKILSGRSNATGLGLNETIFDNSIATGTRSSVATKFLLHCSGCSVLWIQIRMGLSTLRSKLPFWLKFRIA